MHSSVLIIKTGSTLDGLRERRGDFEEWIIPHLPVSREDVQVVSVHLGEFLPALEQVMGIVITGSPAMVTDREGWSEYAAQYLKDAVLRQLPILGICYGHQLLAHALGGQVDYNPRGREIGTHDIQLLPGASSDLLFAETPQHFPTHTTHSQSVLSLPEGATVLGSNAMDANHAVRFSRMAWGVQFHPEFDEDIMRSYLELRRSLLVEEGLDAEALLQGVRATDSATRLLRRFGDIMLDY